MYAEERHQAIANLVLARGRASVAELAGEFAITTETVRRDLNALEHGGFIRRVHGGAVPAGILEPVLDERDRRQVEAKDRIARAAVALIPRPDSVLLIDAGSTTARLVGHLPRDRRLTIFTHAVPIAARIAGQANVELHLLPGRVRPTTQAAVGADTVAALAEVRADVAFMGTNAISAGRGLSTPDTDEAATKRAMIDSADRVVVLADASKLGRNDPIRFATTTRIDVLVTDAAAPRPQLKKFEAAGIEVVVA